MKSYCAPGPAYLLKKYGKNNLKHIAGVLFDKATSILFMFIMTDDGCFNFLRWTGSKAQLQKLEYLLKQTDWFIKPYALKDFFNNSRFNVVLRINPKRIGHIALLLRMLNDESLIEAAIGKGYLDMAALQLTYHNKPIIAKRFSRISTEVMNNPLDYSHIILPVLKIICRLKDVDRIP